MAFEKNAINSSRWSIDETKVLLSFWCEEHIQTQLEGTVRDSEVYKILEKHMIEKGFNRKSGQIKTRLKVLKQQYRLQRDRLATTGSAGKVTFAFFAQMDSVLGQRQSTNPTGILESYIPGVEENNDESISQSQSTVVEENPELDMDATFLSVDIDEDSPAVNVSTQDQINEDDQQNDGNVHNVAATPQPSPSSSKPKRKRKTLKDILPATMEKCVNTFIEYQKKMDKEHMELEKQQLEIEKENLSIKKEALELLKKALA